MVAVTTGSQLFHNIFIEFKAQFLTYLQTFISLPSPVKTNNFHFSKSSWSRLSFLLIGWGGGGRLRTTRALKETEVEVGGVYQKQRVGWSGEVSPKGQLGPCRDSAPPRLLRPDGGGGGRHEVCQLKEGR